MVAMQSSGTEFRIRTFVGVNPPPAVIDKLSIAARQWMRRIGTQGVRWVSPQNFHLTLEFLGDVHSGGIEQLGARLEEACKPFGPIEVVVRGGGCFPDILHPKNFWLGLQGATENLLALQRAVAECTRGIGEPRDGKPFEPHITVAKLEWMNRDQLGHLKRICENPAETDLGPWKIDQIDLVRSDLGPGGAHYQVLRPIRLAGSP